MYKIGGYDKEDDAHKVHYVKVPENHIVIDFDFGLKGIHLPHLYSGDVTKLMGPIDI
jgi:hypothetical protein